MKEYMGKFDITEENGKWNGFTVWYIKPEPCTLSGECLPKFLLFDGTSYRYAKQPLETQDIMKSFWMNDSNCKITDLNLF